MLETLLLISLVILIANLFLGYKAYSRGEQKQDLLEPLERGLSKLETALKDEFTRNREEMNRNAKDAREEFARSFHTFGESVSARMTQIADMQKNQLDTFSQQLVSLSQTNEKKFGELTETLAGKLASFQERMDLGAKDNRNELAAALKYFQEQFKASVSEFNELQKQKFDQLSNKQSELLQTTERRLNEMRSDNNEKLERMRQTVDEKLHKTLEDRLGQSFQIVTDKLEMVHKGLGEMQILANGVGDLKKVLSNVKTRGSLGEYRLEMILEQIMAPDLYQKNVATNPDSRENVEFAIKIPAKDTENGTIWLPIDSKFPQDKYQVLLDAYDQADPLLVDAAIKELEKTIKLLAKDIRDKYINPPFTTDFAIMFLPFEGLYAEVVKRPALFETLQRDYRINISGPSTIAAFLHSLQMGFRTLAIQKRSSEVWTLLGAVKTEFGKFGTFLDGVQKNLEATRNKILQASQKSRTIERKLRDVQALPQEEAVKYIGDAAELDVEDESNNQAMV
ncbi:MAG: DNA recombination protein RmuC [Candidatus Schekmanbacteria bacterium]|nr:DNA recombination protein RmuC [Candidatus Schekmanbacteria bacterium]